MDSSSGLYLSLLTGNSDDQNHWLELQPYTSEQDNQKQCHHYKQNTVCIGMFGCSESYGSNKVINLNVTRKSW